MAKKRTRGPGDRQPVPPRKQRAHKGKKKTSRTPWPLVIGAGISVVVVVLVIVLVRYAGGSSSEPTSPPNGGSQAIAVITSVPPNHLDQVGLGSAQNSLTGVQGQPLLGPNGKPEVFYLGAEYCPFCAAERWAIIVALARFGSFGGLQTTTSSATDVYPSTVTFTFQNATFTSSYVDFVSVETETNQRTPLQRPTPAEQALVDKYDAGGSIPFVDFGNRWVLPGVTYQPDVLQGLSWQQVADALGNPSSDQAQGVLGSANLITASICTLTNDQPAATCSLPSIKKIEAELPKGG